ncbi:voltage-gated chloride channel family protein [Paenibacillus brevis]|nr:voltage-gated chloride channel family protein [Paenibacillus brevis]
MIKASDMKSRLAKWADKESYSGLMASFLKWVVLGALIGILTGSASALFLKGLDAVTEYRMEQPWLLYLLPLGGALVSFLYMRYGKNSGRGNNLILEQVRGGQETIPLRMAPLVLFGTLVTHLLGGSAGREGTAVQMGGSLAEGVGRLIRIDAEDRKLLLMCGISGGFGSVFGTPLAGAVFGLEVIAIGMISHRALVPCFTASFVGNLTATYVWKVGHLHYEMGPVPGLSGAVLLKVCFAAILFGLTARLFSELCHALKKGFTRLIPNPVLKTAAGGVAVIILVFVAGTRDYLGLGIPLIQGSFEEGGVTPFAFLWKLLFTAVTLGAGFQGGEVTPLFAIGAALGSSLSTLLHMYAPFLAALGFIAVFCGAANTPLACFIMGIELFGSEGAVYLMIVCIISYIFSGHTGIYSSQQIGIPKSSILGMPGESYTLEEWKQRKRSKQD